MTKKDAVIVYGAGISGRGAAQVLADRKQQVYLYNDMDCTIEPQLLKLLQGVGGGLAIGQDAFERLLDIAGVLVLSPGIACDSKNVLVAEQRGLEVISEVELGYRLYGGHIAAITGTNGKTTTTTIVGEMLRRLPVPCCCRGQHWPGAV